MDIQAEKLQLIEWIARLNNSAILQKFIDLKKSQEQDWWDEISADEREDIESSMTDIERGEGVGHEQVMAQYKKWLSK